MEPVGRLLAQAPNIEHLILDGLGEADPRDMELFFRSLDQVKLEKLKILDMAGYFSEGAKNELLRWILTVAPNLEKVIDPDFQVEFMETFISTRKVQAIKTLEFCKHNLEYLTLFVDSDCQELECLKITTCPTPETDSPEVLRATGAVLTKILSSNVETLSDIEFRAPLSPLSHYGLEFSPLQNVKTMTLNHRHGSLTTFPRGVFKSNIGKLTWIRCG